MLTLDLVANRYHQRPSQILGIRDEWAAYQFDVAVAVAARENENEQIRPDGSTGKLGSKPPAGGYRNPKELLQSPKHGMRIKKMRVPESGVW